MRKHWITLLAVLLSLSVGMLTGCKINDRETRANNETRGFERYDGFELYEGAEDSENSYDAQTEKSVADAAAPQDIEGNYIITSPKNGTTAIIELPVGFELNYSSANLVAFSDCVSTDVDFGFAEEMTAEELFNTYSDIRLYEAEGGCKNIQVSDVQKMNISGMEVSYFYITYEYMEGQICKEYTAWTPIDVQTFLIAESSAFDDASAVGMDDSIVEMMFKCVKIGSDL